MSNAYFSDSDDERLTAEAVDDTTAVIVPGAPAYNLDTWSVGTGGPQCSQRGEFCYFCAFRKPDPDNGDADTRTDDDDCRALWDIVDDLVEQKREVPHIVTSIHQIYNKHVRQRVKYVHPDTEETLLCPPWTRDSIKRHLIFSTNYPELFDNAIDHIFQSIIYSQNNAVMDAQTNTVLEDRRQALMDTIGQFGKWRSTQYRLGTRRAGKSTTSKPPPYKSHSLNN